MSDFNKLEFELDFGVVLEGLKYRGYVFVWDI